MDRRATGLRDLRVDAQWAGNGASPDAWCVGVALRDPPRRGVPVPPRRSGPRGVPHRPVADGGLSEQSAACRAFSTRPAGRCRDYWAGAPRLVFVATLKGRGRATLRRRRAAAARDLRPAGPPRGRHGDGPVRSDDAPMVHPGALADSNRDTESRRETRANGRINAPIDSPSHRPRRSSLENDAGVRVVVRVAPRRPLTHLS